MKRRPRWWRSRYRPGRAYPATSRLAAIRVMPPAPPRLDEPSRGALQQAMSLADAHPDVLGGAWAADVGDPHNPCPGLMILLAVTSRSPDVVSMVESELRANRLLGRADDPCEDLVAVVLDDRLPTVRDLTNIFAALPTSRWRRYIGAAAIDWARHVVVVYTPVVPRSLRRQLREAYGDRVVLEMLAGWPRTTEEL